MLSSIILYGGLAILAILCLIYLVVAYIDRVPTKHNQVPHYSYDINEHQNYWEADSR